MIIGSKVKRLTDGLTGEVMALDGRQQPENWVLVEFDALPEGEQNPQWWQFKDLEEAK